MTSSPIVTLSIVVYEQQDQVSLNSLGPDLVPSAKRRLMSRIRSMFVGRPLGRHLPPISLGLQTLIDSYGEQVTQDALGDINKYFARVLPTGATWGGVSTSFAPLAITPKFVKPSNTAISVIGEGIAGWFLSRQGLSPLARPISEPIDLICQNVSTPGPQYALVQVKSTQEPNILSLLQGTIPELLDYGFKMAARPRSAPTYSCYAVGVIIKPANAIDIYSLRIDLV